MGSKVEKAVGCDSTVTWSRERKAMGADWTTCAAAVTAARSATVAAMAAQADFPQAARRRGFVSFMGVCLSFALLRTGRQTQAAHL